MPVRQDYILRLIDELRQFVGTMLQGGDPGRGEEALHAVLHAQQKLFQRPPAEFLGLDLDRQLDLLAKGESPEGAAEKAATYAVILAEAARIYDGTNRPSLAFSSRQLALSVVLTAARRWPAQRTLFAESVDSLRARLPAADLHPPVRELLADWDGAV